MFVRPKGRRAFLATGLYARNVKCHLWNILAEEIETNYKLLDGITDSQKNTRDKGLFKVVSGYFCKTNT